MLTAPRYQKKMGVKVFCSYRSLHLEFTAGLFENCEYSHLIKKYAENFSFRLGSPPPRLIPRRSDAQFS